MKKLDSNQLKMYKYCCSVNNPLLFVDMRMGKSIVTIRWVKTIIDSGLVLITCPYSGIFGWVDELRNEGENDIILAIGSKESRMSMACRLIFDIDTHIRWVLTNPECHRSCAQVLNKPYKVWIADEATYLQNYTSKTSQYYFKNTSHIQHKIALTGTPATEGEQQFFMLCKIIESNCFLEGNYYQFINSNFGKLPNHQLILNARGGKYITDRLSKYALFMSRKDFNVGGKITRVTRFSSISKINDIYRKTEREFILEIKEQDIYKETIWATKKWLWLRRLCSGIIDNIVIDSTKLDDLKNLIISEFHKKQVLIWAIYHEEIDNIYSYLKSKFEVVKIDGRMKPLQREAARRSFMNKDVNIVIGNPYALRFGADFSIAQVVIYFSLPVSGLTYAQSEARPINIRTNNDLLIIYMLREKSVEVDIFNSVIKKENRRDTLRNIIKGLRERN